MQSKTLQTQIVFWALTADSDLSFSYLRHVSFEVKDLCSLYRLFCLQLFIHADISAGICHSMRQLLIDPTYSKIQGQHLNLKVISIRLVENRHERT